MLYSIYIVIIDISYSNFKTYRKGPVLLADRESPHISFYVKRAQKVDPFATKLWL